MIHGTPPFDVQGSDHYRRWRASLDLPTRRRIASRMRRIEEGDFGDCRSLGAGLFELRFHFGPGYRIYFCREGRSVVVLIAGGHKGAQLADIAFARHAMVRMRGGF